MRAGKWCSCANSLVDITAMLTLVPVSQMFICARPRMLSRAAILITINNSCVRYYQPPQLRLSLHLKGESLLHFYGRDSLHNGVIVLYATFPTAVPNHPSQRNQRVSCTSSATNTISTPTRPHCVHLGTSPQQGFGCLKSVHHLIRSDISRM